MADIPGLRACFIAIIYAHSLPLLVFNTFYFNFITALISKNTSLPPEPQPLVSALVSVWCNETSYVILPHQEGKRSFPESRLSSFTGQLPGALLLRVGSRWAQRRSSTALSPRRRPLSVSSEVRVLSRAS